jgi:hypothetical protein
MSTFKRGGIYWYEFSFNGARVRESARTSSKAIAKAAELKRRRDLALSINGLTKREPPPLFPLAAKQWLDSKTALTPLGRAYYDQYVGKLKRHFGNRLVSDITADDIAALQRKRQAEKLSGRQINCEVATLRCVLRHCGLWAGISHRVKLLKERTDTGRALSPGDEAGVLDAIAQSPSAAPRRKLEAGAASRSRNALAGRSRFGCRASGKPDRMPSYFRFITSDWPATAANRICGESTSTGR